MAGITGDNFTETYRGEGGAAGSLLSGTAVIHGTADDQAKAPGGAGVAGLGVLAKDEEGGDDRLLEVITFGQAKMIAGAAVAVGEYLKIGGVDGRVIPVAEGAGTTEQVVGRARSAAAADGDEFDGFVDNFILTTET
jgi:hypothetical protein